MADRLTVYESSGWLYDAGTNERLYRATARELDDLYDSRHGEIEIDRRTVCSLCEEVTAPEGICGTVCPECLDDAVDDWASKLSVSTGS